MGLAYNFFLSLKLTSTASKKIKPSSFERIVTIYNYRKNICEIMRCDINNVPIPQRNNIIIFCGIGPLSISIHNC